MKFLIYISQPYSIPIGRPLQEEIHSRGYAVKWFCDEAQTASYLNVDEYVLGSVAEVKAYQPDVVLVATNIVPDFFPGIKVQIFHGFSVGKRSEKKGHFNIRGFFDLYCTQGPSTTKPFEILQKKYQYFQVIETGWSKVDPLFPLKKCMHTTPTVIISSTFTTKLSLAKNEEAVAEIERLSKIGRWKFIAVLHPKMEREVVEKFKMMQHDNFIFYDTTDLMPLFKQADVMLSDTTSAITEFVLQKKPVVTLNNNQPSAHMINIKNASQIEEALEKAFSKPKDIMHAIEAFIAFTHPYSDGKSSARVIDASIKFVKDSNIKRKPLNLVRKYQIRKKLGYWGLW
ncbi:CDP-glycerol glycerophosphotransferase [cyanobacterium G8-9]|nr:CDP-glycerol glycerophosphotransferase [cyanobacterium G8-9]